MIEKVDELVEWVANEIWTTIHPSRACTLRQAGKDTMSVYYKAAKQIISHPDLALIDGEKIQRMYAMPSWFWKNCKQQRKKPAKICLVCPFIDCKTGMAKCLPVIPLAEAIKEVEG